MQRAPFEQCKSESYRPCAQPLQRHLSRTLLTKQTGTHISLPGDCPPLPRKLSCEYLCKLYFPLIHSEVLSCDTKIQLYLMPHEQGTQATADNVSPPLLLTDCQLSMFTAAGVSDPLAQCLEAIVLNWRPQSLYFTFLMYTFLQVMSSYSYQGLQELINILWQQSN